MAKAVLTMTRYDDRITIITETYDDSSISPVDAYLVTGSKRALLIDTLMMSLDLYDRVREATALPLDVLITHGHPDHSGAGTKKFYDNGCTVYLNPKDYESARSFGIDPAIFTPLDEGAVFDTGGTKLETIMLPGHTQGSAVFLDRERHQLFSGDAIGSGGFWMQIPGTTSLRALRVELGRLWDIVRDMRDLAVFPGHRYQAPRHDRAYLEDVIRLTDDIISGAVKGVERDMTMMGQRIHYRSASYHDINDYCYREENI